MNPRINYERVRKIKNVIYTFIYTFIILLVLVPAIMLIVLGVQVMGYIGPIRSLIDQHEAGQAATPVPLTPPAPAAPAAPTPQPPPPPQQSAELFPVPPILEPDDPDTLGQIAALPEPALEDDEIAGQLGAPPPGQGGGTLGTATGMPVDVGIPQTGLPR